MSPFSVSPSVATSSEAPNHNRLNPNRAHAKMRAARGCFRPCVMQILLPIIGVVFLVRLGIVSIILATFAIAHCIQHPDKPLISHPLTQESR